MRVLNAVVRYFDLYSERRSDLAVGRAGHKTPSIGALSLLSMYLAVLFGVAAKILFDPGAGSIHDLSWARVIVSLVITTAVFPAIFKQTLDKSNVPFLVRWCLAFGGGFGYKALIDIGK